MADSAEGLSRSVEDYLKAIFSLTERGEPASTSAVAQILDVQPGSVTGMVKRLAESGLLEHVPYRGVRLTDRGTREALLVVRRHRILESYLVERLGYTWDDVHAEAERLEHAASDRLVERMAAALEDPSRDPHGAPIPTSAGEIEPMDFATLADATPGLEVQIRAVADEDGELLRHLESRGLLPGVRLRVEEDEEASGTVTVRLGGAGGAKRVVGRELASLIYVTQVTPAGDAP